MPQFDVYEMPVKQSKPPPFPNRDAKALIGIFCISGVEAMMPLLIRNKAARAAVQLAHASGMRSTNEAIDQLQGQVKELQAQLQREREQHTFNLGQAEQEKLILSRELIEARIEIAWRNQRDAFAQVPSPSAMVH